jgi:predicted transcriptional regulator YdeE
MLFKGISRSFSLLNENQYNTIGAFWDEMIEKYGLENLVGLGYEWDEKTIKYAIGLKNGDIDGFDFSIELPDCGWQVAYGRTEQLKELYDSIYKSGPLTYEIETFFEDESCVVKYYRKG